MNTALKVLLGLAGVGVVGYMVKCTLVKSEWEEIIASYKPDTFHPMTFGMYVDSASYLYIREHSSDYIHREIEMYDELQVDLFRIDCRHDIFLEHDEDSINKLDSAIDQIRTTDKRLMLGMYGVQSWFDVPVNWDTWKDMYREQTDILMERYHPDSMYILPEAPPALHKQIIDRDNITVEEWGLFTEEISKRIKNTNPSTLVVFAGVLHHPLSPPVFTQLMSRINNIDIMGNNPYSVDETLNTDNYLDCWHNSPDNKEMWITEAWSNSNIEYERFGVSAYHIKFAVYYAQSRGLNGFILFGGSWSMHKDGRFRKLDTFYAYKDVINEIKGI